MCISFLSQTTPVGSSWEGNNLGQGSSVHQRQCSMKDIAVKYKQNNIPCNLRVGALALKRGSEQSTSLYYW